jgi:hypothetical protein
MTLHLFRAQKNESRKGETLDGTFSSMLPLNDALALLYVVDGPRARGEEGQELCAGATFPLFGSAESHKPYLRSILKVMSYFSKYERFVLSECAFMCLYVHTTSRFLSRVYG